MSFLRQMLNPADAEIRPPTQADKPAIEKVLRRADFQYSSLVDTELELLLQAPIGALMWIGSQVVALLLAGLAPPPVSWIRAAAVDRRLRAGQALPPLLAKLHHDAYARQINQIFFIGDPWSSSWLQPHLKTAGYQPTEEVISCEKRDWQVPSAGNTAVTLRAATPADISTIAALDCAAFDRQWAKAAPVLASGLSGATLFLIAEEQGQAVGYALVTEHYEGRLAHLVRLAVLPERQGQGIGVRLLAEIVGFCRGRRTQALSLNTQASNVSARRLYSWFGFEPTGDRQAVLRRQLP